jgi:GTPase SAR1 family protein
MVVFDLNDAKSLLDAQKWYEDAIKVAVAPDVIVCLVGNKADQVDKRQVSEEHALTLANELGIPYFETSAKTGVDVDYIFTSVASVVVKKRNRLQATK